MQIWFDIYDTRFMFLFECISTTTTTAAKNTTVKFVILLINHFVWLEEMAMIKEKTSDAGKKKEKRRK